jgi:transposase-like protein
MASEPKTLQDAIIYFANPDNCIDYLAARRWKNGVVCPACGSKDVSFVASRRVWQCKTRHPKAQFSIKVGTIFEDSPITLDKWLLAMWMLANCKNGVSSYEISRSTGISQKSTWFMLQRIRLALQGGRARNMHKSRKARMLGGAKGGVVGKIAVQGLLERHGKVRTRVVGDIRKRDLVDGIKQHVEAGTNLYTDDVFVYDGIEAYNHQVINHAEKYVDGQVHTNGLENFWSLLKRGLHGTYISVEPFHLFRYVDEQAFRYNNRRDMTDSDRFDLAVRQIVGKRLTWAEVTGKVGEKQNLN